MQPLFLSYKQSTIYSFCLTSQVNYTLVQIFVPDSRYSTYKYSVINNRRKLNNAEEMFLMILFIGDHYGSIQNDKRKWGEKQDGS